MNYRNFSDYVSEFKGRGERSALTIRSFIKIERLSYAAFQVNIYKTANFLKDRGYQAGDRLMIVASNSPEWLEVFLAAELLGVIVVSVDISLSSATIKGFIKQTEPKGIFVSRYKVNEFSKSLNLYVIDDLYQDIAVYLAEPPGISLSDEQKGLIVFTSGTTAAPKGVVLTQANILNNVLGIQRAIAIDPDWRLLSVLPLSHMYELTGSLSVISKGASIFYLKQVTPSAIAKALVEYRISVMLAIPQLLGLMMGSIEQIAKNEGQSGALLVARRIARYLPFGLRRKLFSSVHKRLGGHLNLIVTGGAPIPEDVALKWELMGVRLLQGYGLTETSPILTVNRMDDRHADSPGPPLDNVELKIAEDGEILARGPSIFSEYWHNKTATEETFTSNGWFITGDAGMIKNGLLYIRGRLKFAIVLSSGLKVFPEDIEERAVHNEAFSELCIVGVNTAGGEEVTAVVTSVKSDDQIAKAIEEINDKLESYQYISSWKRWPEEDFPRTRLLKVDRRLVWDWANKKTDAGRSANEEPASKDVLVEAIRLTCGKQLPDARDSNKLAELGLDSLKRLALVAVLEETLRVSIPEEYISSGTTVGQLRNLIKEAPANKASKPIPKWQFNPYVRLIGNALRDYLLGSIVRIWVRLKVEGTDNLNDLNCPAIYIFNHTDDFDGPVVYRAIPKNLRKHLTVAAADDVLREHKVLAFIIRLCFAGFNLSRKEPYLPSLEYVGTVIDKGFSVVISPEGKISVSGKLQDFKSGIGLLAVELGVPIVPLKTFGLRGTVPLHANWPKKHSHVTVKIGRPVVFGRDQSYNEVARKLHQILNSM